MPALNDNKTYTDAKRVIIISVALNILLMAYKIAAGIIGNSAAMIADGVHSFSDFLTDVIAMVGARYAVKPEDEGHPYGHGRVETFASFTIAASLLLVAIGIFYNAVTIISNSDELGIPKAIALTAALISIIVKEFLFRYTIKVGKKHNLQSLIANAWHHRSDAYSSFASMAGIIGAMMGFPLFDPLAAGIVALFIGKVGVEIGRDAFMELIDTAADKKIRDGIEEIIKETKEVRHYHDLKTRKVGSKVISDLHIEVNPSISVVEGHNIAKGLKTKIIEQVKEVENILIHIEPDGDREGIVYEVDKDDLKSKALRVCKNVTGVLGMHSLKVHHYGSEVIINVDIEVAPESTVAEGHKVARHVKECLFGLGAHIKDVVVHIDLYEGER